MQACKRAGSWKGLDKSTYIIELHQNEHQERHQNSVFRVVPKYPVAKEQEGRVYDTTRAGHSRNFTSCLCEEFLLHVIDHHLLDNTVGCMTS